MLAIILLACQVKEADFKGWSSETISLSSADYHFIGENYGDYAGYSVAGIGDVDDDDVDDFVIAADHNHHWGFATGKVYLFSGGMLGKRGEYSLSEANYIFTGESDEDLLGHGMSAAGDLDEDGLDDFLITAYVDSNEHLENGSVYLIHGADLGDQKNIDLSQIEDRFIGDATLDRLGHDVSTGDIDGDGINDILMGAYGHDQDRGRTYLFVSGSRISGERRVSEADVILEGEDLGDKSGYSIEIVGDVDQDGYPEVHISSKERNQGHHQAGKTYLVSGATLLQGSAIQELSDAQHQFLGQSSFELCCNPASIGDLDLDGGADLLLGSQFNMDASSWVGSTYIVLSSSLGETGTHELSEADYIFAEEQSGDMLGNGLTGLGDLDQDGLNDFLIGAFLNSPSSTFDGGGTSYLFFGSQLASLPQQVSVLEAAHQFEGSREKEGGGRGLSNIGDVNGDSLNDILIGAPMEPNSREGGTGGAYLFITPGE